MKKITTAILILLMTMIFSCACNEVVVTNEQKEYLDKINEVRILNGLQALQPTKKLNYIAILRCSDMTERDYFSHYTPEGIRVKYGEILARDLTGEATPEEIIECWLESPTHRQEILNPQYRYIGIGIEENIITILFSSRYSI